MNLPSSSNPVINVPIEGFQEAWFKFLEYQKALFEDGRTFESSFITAGADKYILNFVVR